MLWHAWHGQYNGYAAMIWLAGLSYGNGWLAVARLGYILYTMHYACYAMLCCDAVCIEIRIVMS